MTTLLVPKLFHNQQFFLHQSGINILGEASTPTFKIGQEPLVTKSTARFHHVSASKPQPPLGFRLSDLPGGLVLAIANAAPIRDRCMLHQTCKHLHSLLADSVTEKRRLTAQVLPLRQAYEERDWEWSSPNAIAGIDMGIRPFWGYDFRFSEVPHRSESLRVPLSVGILTP